MSDGQNKYKLVLPFTTDDPMFSRGFEAGMLYMRMNAKEPVISGGTYRQSNMDQFQLMAGHLGYSISNAEILADGWFYADFERLAK